MDVPALEQLQQITHIAYQRAQQKLAEISAEERTLRDELDRLQSLDAKARATAGQDMALAALGGDLLWQGWLARSRTSLNMALARVLAVKEYHLKTTRTAYGKLMVAEEMLQTARHEKRKLHQQRQLAEAIETAVLQTKDQ